MEICFAYKRVMRRAQKLMGQRKLMALIEKYRFIQQKAINDETRIDLNTTPRGTIQLHN